MLLGLAAVLAALPWSLSLLVAGAVAAHGVWRRPTRAPQRLVVGEDGVCRIGDGEGTLVFERGTTVGPYWVRLVLACERDAVDILLLKDQLPAETWARLVAMLRRVRPAKSATRRSGGPDLR